MENGTVTQLDRIEQLTETNSKKRRDRKGPYYTERGVVLKYRKVSSDVVRRGWTAIPVPTPPMVWIEDHGRDEPNPTDPGYNNQLSQYNHKVSAVIHTLYMMRGIDVFSIPEGMPGPESDDWFEGLEEFFEIPKGKLARQAMWLLDYVLDDKERDEIIEDLMILSGYATEKEVDQASESFRDNSVPEADKQVSSNE